MRNKVKLLFVLFVLLSVSLFSQFGEEPFSGTGDPDIEFKIDYKNGLIILNFSMEDNFHITDIKEGFFEIKIEKNNYIKIAKLVFPDGVIYSDDRVYKGEFEVKVYIGQLKEITESLNTKLSVTYQICKEKPVEMCFPPASKEIKLNLEKSFEKYKIEKIEKIKSEKKIIEKKPNPIAKVQKKVNKLSPVILLSIALFLLAFAVFFGLFTPTNDEDIKEKLKKALLILIFITGAFLFIKYLETDGTKPETNIKAEDRVELIWLNSIEEGKKLALKENKKIMIDTYADWCVACKELEEYTFGNPDVAKILKEEYVLVKVDFTKETEANNKLRKKLGVIGMPTVIFLNTDGTEKNRFSGFYDKDMFLGFIGSQTGFFDKMLALLEKELDKRSFILFFLIFGLGFLTSLTPCVYPVIPIVMGYVGTRSGGKKLKGFYLSIFFVLGLSIVYSILGVIAGATGSMMGVSFQNPIIVIIIASIFIIMGLSMAGLFDIPVPSSISSKMQGGGKSEIIGSMVIGGVAGVIAAPCVGPVLIALLSWISQTGNIFLGFLLTFIFSLGMGVIFLLVGTFSGLVSALPKGGKWMENVKYFFASILIAGGIYVLNPVIPEWTSTLLWGIYLISMSVFLGVLKILVESNLKEKLGRLLVLLILIYGLFLFFGSADKGYFGSADIDTKIESGWLKK